jgi:hypothetical protein
VARPGRARREPAPTSWRTPAWLEPGLFAGLLILLGAALLKRKEIIARLKR